MKLIGWTSWNADLPEAEGDSLYLLAKHELVGACLSGKGKRISGDKHQHDPEGVPMFEHDGAVYVLKCSMREWGGIMADAYGGDYMDFYMDFKSLLRQEEE